MAYPCQCIIKFVTNPVVPELHSERLGVGGDGFGRVDLVLGPVQVLQ